jgi:hypothetical protein
MRGGEELGALAVGVDLVRDAPRHLADPARDFRTRGVVGGTGASAIAFDKAAHDGLRKLLFLLRTGERGQRRREKRGSESCTQVMRRITANPRRSGFGHGLRAD